MYRRSVVTDQPSSPEVPFTVTSTVLDGSPARVRGGAACADGADSTEPVLPGSGPSSEWIVPEGLATAPPQLVIMDVDSTFINEEVIDLLADQAGVGQQVARVTERAMRGELDFNESLYERVAALAGLDESVLAATAARVTYTSGVPEFVARVQANGGRVALVSGGFTPIVRALAQPLGITDVLANQLEVAGGTLTGRVTGTIVNKEVKVATLRRLLTDYHLDPARSVAIGDGSNDALMIEQAALGVAFCAKPALRRVADVEIDVRDMRAVWSALTGESF